MKTCRKHRFHEKNTDLPKVKKASTDELSMKKQNRLDTLVWINEQKEGRR